MMVMIGARPSTSGGIVSGGGLYAGEGVGSYQCGRLFSVGLGLSEQA
jgi:hypothetical protein